MFTLIFFKVQERKPKIGNFIQNCPGGVRIYLLLLLLLLLLTKKLNVAFSPEELQGHGTHVNRRRVQYSTVLVEGRSCAISMTWQ